MPSVLVGSSLGARFGRLMPEDVMEDALGAVFASVGGLVLAIELLA